MTTSPRERFERACSVVARRCGGLVAPTLIGFAVINGCTFAVDLALVTAFRGGLGWPLWLAVGVAYALALGLSFVLNRELNFRTHRRVGRQVGLWVAVMVVNYAGIVVGVTVGLATLGVPYQLARLGAGVVEAAFMYSCLRWLVFRDRPLLARR